MIPRIKLAWGGLSGTGPRVTVLGEGFMLPSNVGHRAGGSEHVG